ncbi:tetratricopeptide repeat protein [Geminocystis herdmanii]|uniref:tetratricopeptide repeat protein n=1 Tax=Geminocystis herdmanii TaxID=669359 RepID=UPI000345029B|nr:tetratricopeptide repeat protein [Geminocystis herdmanii]
MIRLSNLSARIWFHRAKTLGSIAQETEVALDAISYYEDAIKSLAQSFSFSQPQDEHYQELQSLRQSFPEGLASKYYVRGICLKFLNKNEEALIYFNKAIRQKADYVDAWFERGIVLINLDKNDEAFTSFNKVLELNPQHVKSLIIKSFILRDDKKYEEALNLLDRAIDVEPNNAEAWKERGRILISLDKNDEALTSFSRAIECDPNDAEACRLRSILLEMQE